jgi:hypothetical protein
MNDLEIQGYEVKTDNSEDLNILLDKVNEGFDAYLFDFRLTANKGRLDAPSIAQAMRTKGKNYKESPIFLISDEGKLKEFNKDLSSQDLFDFAVSKTNFRKDIEKYSKRINSFISAYKEIKENKFQMNKILGLSSSEIEKLIDYRLLEITKNEKIKNDVFAYCRFLNITLIRGIGPLIGEEILSARLGVKKESNDWPTLLEILKDYRYKGILSDVYSRWWMQLVLDWWNKEFQGESLRRNNSLERVTLLKNKFNLDLQPIDPIEYAVSSNFWTICKDSKNALDPIDGYIINSRVIEPWHELEYLSLKSALEHTKSRDFLSPNDKAEIRKIEKDLRIKKKDGTL